MPVDVVRGEIHLVELSSEDNFYAHMPVHGLQRFLGNLLYEELYQKCQLTYRTKLMQSFDMCNGRKMRSSSIDCQWKTYH